MRLSWGGVVDTGTATVGASFPSVVEPTKITLKSGYKNALITVTGTSGDSDGTYETEYKSMTVIGLLNIDSSIRQAVVEYKTKDDNPRNVFTIYCTVTNSDITFEGSSGGAPDSSVNYSIHWYN